MTPRPAASGRHDGTGGVRVVPLPGTRRVILDYLAVAHRKHLVHALVEVDATLPRRLLREHRARTGESLSFTAFVIACLARAVDGDPSVQAYRLGRRRLVVFDDVDVSVLVERDAGGGPRVATPHVIRAANRRACLEIHRELRALQAATFPREVRAGGRVPGFAGRWFWRVLGMRPRLRKRLAGTVSVTSVGMFGDGAGWGIPIGDYTLMLTIGGIATRPAFAADGRIEPREYLSLTVSVDHDVVDGAPAARFIQRLKELLEGGDGLPSASTEPPSSSSASRE
ncbi:MAG TPA: 2-oxo acid dehydrogenase subunit E2 [Longimicrobium sp.]|nr:2-oxo acid dehydrogenase subunit E2 [Longimicrobium sp.]